MATYYIRLPPEADLSRIKQVCITEKGSKITIDPFCKCSDVVVPSSEETQLDLEARRRAERQFELGARRREEKQKKETGEVSVSSEEKEWTGEF
jgi:virulence-associated protein VagC